MILFGLLVTLMVAFVGTTAWHHHDLAAARKRVMHGSHAIESAFGRIEYVLAGHGTPVLVVHGAGGGFDQGLAMTRRAADQGLRLIVPSRFGYLRSTMPEGATAATQATAYRDLLDHLRLDRVAVVSISAGAWSALQFAEHYPDRCAALVLLVPAKSLPPGVSNNGGALVRALFSSDLLMWGADKLMRLAPGMLAPVMLATPADIVRDATPAEKVRLMHLIDGLLPVTQRLAGMQLDIATAQKPEPSALERITCPVLTISADDDQFGTAARARTIAASVTHGRSIIYPTGGHALVGRQDEVLTEVVRFIHEAAAGQQQDVLRSR